MADDVPLPRPDPRGPPVTIRNEFSADEEKQMRTDRMRERDLPRVPSDRYDIGSEGVAKPTWENFRKAIRRTVGWE